MSFNINKVIKDMKNAAVDAIKDDLDDIPVYARQIFDNEKDALRALAEARITGEITDKQFQRELKREKKVLEAEMLTISIISKAIAQKAVNAAINVLMDAVKLAV